MKHLTLLVLYSLTVIQLGAFTPGMARGDMGEDLNRGYSLIDQWRIPEAEQHIHQLEQRYPNSGDVHFLKSRLEFYKGQYEEAWELLKQVEDTAEVVRDFKGLVSRTRDATSGFITRETAHFQLRYPEGANEILVPYAEEVLESSYQVLGKILGYFPEEKVIIEIYPDRVPFSQISPLTLKDILTSGTVALCKYRRIMMITPASAVRGYNWMDTLSHEYVHYLLSAASHNNAPLWLHEGIAKYLEGRWRNAGHMNPTMETVLASGLKNDYLVPLEDMMPSLAKLKSPEDVQLAYAEVATMVEYMVHLKGEPVFPKLIRDLKEGQAFEHSLEKNLDTDLGSFQEQWKRHMKEKKLKSIPGLKVLRFEFKNKDGENKADPDSSSALNSTGGKRARDLTLLGDILKERRHINAAIIEYEKAIAESQSLSPVLYNKLAETYLDEKQLEPAERLLTESLGYYPEFSSTLVNLGELKFMQQDFKAAEGYYQKAVRLNPFHPYLHARLIATLDKLGKQDDRDRQRQLYGLLK